MLFGVIGVAAILTIIRISLPINGSGPVSAGKASLNGAESGRTINNRTYRATLPPSGAASIQLTRSKYNSMPLVDMNDRGDYLFLAASPSSPAPRQYIHIFNGKSVKSEVVAASTRWMLTSSGKIISRTATGRVSPFLTGRLGGTQNFWPYNELRFMSRFDEDGSSFGIQFIMRNRTHSFAFERFGTDAKNEILYQSARELQYIERSDNNTFWVREATDAKSINANLVRLSQGKSETVTLPQGYSAVERMAQTGEKVAGTFGNITSDQPIRSFVKVGNDWKELPIPPGYVFSYVQKIFTNGLILGFVTDASRDVARPVVWDGDKVAELEKLPSWPKNGTYSVITNATRRGDIYVRTVLNTSSGASESYLMHVSKN